MRRLLARLLAFVMATSLLVLGVTLSATSAHAAPAAPSAPATALGNGSVADPNIVYTGRWDLSSATAAVPNWTGGYLQTAFTGTTVKIKARDAVNFYASVDGGADVFYAGVKGTVNLTPQPLPQGNHTLRVSYRSGDTVFQGLVLDSGAGTTTPRVPSKLVEFVGDSITAGALTDRLALDSYGWKTGEQLGMRHTQIARAGYCLVGKSGCVGLAAQFFKTASTGDQAWDFSRYQANAVVINLGTNDIGHSVTGPEFQSAYTTLLRDIRAKYPNAALFAVQTLKKRYLAETKAAVSARNAAGDAKVYYVDTTGWLTDGTDYEDGNGHPNEAGHTKFTGRWDTTDLHGRLRAGVGRRLPEHRLHRHHRQTQAAQQHRPLLQHRRRRRQYLTNRTGTVDLTPVKLAAGRHTLRVSYRVVAGSYHGDAVFQGLTLDSGAQTYALPAPGQAHRVRRRLHHRRHHHLQERADRVRLADRRAPRRRHTQIAQGGACLVTTADGCVGLEDYFLKLSSSATPRRTGTSARYRADAVVINLGTNDGQPMSFPCPHGLPPRQPSDLHKGEAMSYANVCGLSPHVEERGSGPGEPLVLLHEGFGAGRDVRPGPGRPAPGSGTRPGDGLHPDPPGPLVPEAIAQTNPLSSSASGLNRPSQRFSKVSAKAKFCRDRATTSRSRSVTIT
jgi:lysophospholipase L1-like esterase